MNIIEFIEDERFINDQSLSLPQKVTLKALYALPLDREEKRVYSKLTALEKYHPREYRESVIICGRRSGKSDKLSSNIAIFEAVMRDHSKHLSTGERGFVLVIASSMRQARTLFGYIEGKLKNSKILSRMIANETKEEIALNNRVTIGIYPCNQRHRGLSIICAVLDEASFFRHEGIMVDKEIVDSIKPSLITFPHSKLLLVSSPYGKKGIVYESFKDHYGNDTETLIVQASSDYMNPRISSSFVQKELEKNPSFAKAEYLGLFRDDLQDFLTPEIIDAVILEGVYEIPYNSNFRFHAFADMSGGRVDDSALSISAKDDKGHITQCCLRVKKSPHNPLQAVKEFAEVLKSYELYEVTGDRYASDFNREAWKNEGIRWINSEKDKSSLYTEFLPIINTQGCSLLDNRELVIQLRNLERRTGGLRDKIDHPRGLKDDISNSSCGSVVMANEADRDFLLIPSFGISD